MPRSATILPLLLSAALVMAACSSKTSDNNNNTGQPVKVPLATFELEKLWTAASTDWEPYIAADLGSQWVYQATTRATSTRMKIMVRASSDGGVTWGNDVLVSSTTSAYDPQLAVARDTGCVFAAYLEPSDWLIYVRSSCDHGATWSTPVCTTPSTWSGDHPWLLVTPSGIDVYVAFNATPPGVSEDAGEGYVAVSHNGGASFTQVYVTGTNQEYWFEDGGALGPNGEIYVANAVFSLDYTGPASVVLWRSNNAGASFETLTLATSEEVQDCSWDAACDFGFFAAQAAVAVDAGGRIMFVWSASTTPGGPMKMYAAFSPGGDAWRDFGAPIVLSSDLYDSNFPTAAAGPTSGDFRVAWQSRSSSTNLQTWNTWYQATIDGGNTWIVSPVRLSNRTDGATYKADLGYGFPFGDFLGLAVDSAGMTQVVWGEADSRSGPGGSWYTRTVPPASN